MPWSSPVYVDSSNCQNHMSAELTSKSITNITKNLLCSVCLFLFKDSEIFVIMMDSSLEIRKLLPSHVRELASMLETHELWKRLMNIIPKTLDRLDYQCKVTASNQHKYNSEHFRLIENESEKSRRTCTEILLDEWGTSGKIRPALGHLLYLLTQAKLFRAADYVAVDLLHQEKPSRPDIGPEAPIPVNLSDIIQQPDDVFERALDNIDYVSDAVNLIRTYSDKTPKKASKIPEIVITPDIDDNINVPKLNLPIVAQRTKQVEEVPAPRELAELNSQEIPVVVNEINNETSNTQELNMPNLSLIMDKSTPQESSTDNSTSISNSVSDTYTQSSGDSESIISESLNPAFSQLMETDTQNLERMSGSYNPAFSQILETTDKNAEENIPNLSILNLEKSSVVSEENMLPDFDVLQQQSGVIEEKSTNLPDFNHLNLGSTSINMFSNSSQASSHSSLKRSCSSPLPNLSLHTILPHFSYQKLEQATNNFNCEDYVGQNSEGRLLGKGEFGSVFLAISLLDRPVAVKKLDIGDVEIVSVDDEVTKQFSCEVEVLSKYKHENLLSLLGYSCDGCTYCLVYEYMPGGALRDRLQDIDNQLPWKQRLNIALGTSEAISYLHTAFATPLIHRDIKSANILLDSNTQPKLCDFGLIKLIPNQNINIATTIFGTSAYMPREAFGGDISVKLDTFSFGVVLLELLTSLPPIDTNREGADLVTHIGEIVENDEINPIVDHKAGSWEEKSVDYAMKLYKIAQHCLEEKKNRPTMTEVKIALQNVVKEMNN